MSEDEQAKTLINEVPQKVVLSKDKQQELADTGIASLELNNKEEFIEAPEGISRFTLAWQYPGPSSDHNDKRYTTSYTILFDPKMIELKSFRLDSRKINTAEELKRLNKEEGWQFNLPDTRVFVDATPPGNDGKVNFYGFRPITE